MNKNKKNVVACAACNVTVVSKDYILDMSNSTNTKDIGRNFADVFISAAVKFCFILKVNRYLSNETTDCV